MMNKAHYGVNIDIGARCTLECSACSRTKLRKKGLPIPGKDITLDQFKKIANFFEYINFCGQVSDPIMNNNFIEFLKICNDKKIRTTVHVAASHRKEKWWSEAFEANKKAEWIFGIDGLPEDSHKYRKNQDGVKLFNMMLLAKSMGIRCAWQYIIFNYNENTIEEAKRISEKNNIRFNLVATSRFSENDPLRPSSKKYYMHKPQKNLTMSEFLKNEK